MRRSKLPKISFPGNNANLSLASKKSDEYLNEHQNERPVSRCPQLPPIGDNSVLLGPPPGKPQYGRRAARPKTGLHHSKSQSQTLPLAPVVESPGTNTPRPWGTEEPFPSYKEYMSQKMSVTPANSLLPDILEKKGQTSRNHLRIRPANKDLLILNEMEYNYEPAVMPSNISPQFPPTNGRSLPIKSPRIRTTNRAKSNGSNTSLENVPTTGERYNGASRLPPLDKFLQKRGISRRNHFN